MVPRHPMAQHSPGSVWSEQQARSIGPPLSSPVYLMDPDTPGTHSKLSWRTPSGEDLTRCRTQTARNGR